MAYKTEVRNGKGEVVKLTAQEQIVASQLQNEYDTKYAPRLSGSMQNALGFEVDITTLTQVLKSVTEQKFYEVNFADYLPVVVGEGAWSAQIMKYRSFDAADDFETGVINTGAGNARLASVSTAVEPVYTPVINWAKEITYNIIDLQQASRSGNWDLVTSLEGARLRNFKLGLQEIAFWGSKVNSNVKGLLTMSDVNNNTSIITKNISLMSASEFNAFVATIMEAYRANAQRTAMPAKFVVPETDYNGLISFPDAAFPLKTKLELLLEAFRTITRNPNFEILPSAYADQSQNADVAGLNVNRYVLLTDDADSVRMDIPVDYTNTMQNTLNGFTFQNVGYAQYTGAVAYRPREVLYFSHTNAS